MLRGVAPPGKTAADATVAALSEVAVLSKTAKTATWRRCSIRSSPRPGEEKTAAKSRVAVLDAVGAASIRHQPAEHEIRRGVSPRLVYSRTENTNISMGWEFAAARRGSEPEKKGIRGGGRVGDLRTIGGKTLAGRRFGRPQGVNDCGRLPRPAKTANAAVAAVFLAARRGIRSRPAQGSMGPKGRSVYGLGMTPVY